MTVLSSPKSRHANPILGAKLVFLRIMEALRNAGLRCGEDRSGRDGGHEIRIDVLHAFVGHHYCAVYRHSVDHRMVVRQKIRQVIAMVVKNAG